MESVDRVTKRTKKAKARKVRETLESIRLRLEEEMPRGHDFIVMAYRHKKGRRKRMRIAANVDRLEQFRAASDFCALAERKVNGSC
jgi:hypothetical protein